MPDSTILLGVNIDHAATLRQARYRDAGHPQGGVVEPDPVFIALCAEEAGADGITVHLREDRRHIQENDVRRLRECIRSRLNLEMAVTPAMEAFALEILPEAVCLVPEGRAEVTTEGGLDVVGQAERIRVLIERLGGAGIEVSLFIDPDEAQIEKAADLGAPVVELHTGAFANARIPGQREAALRKLEQGCILADRVGLQVNAGHGINYQNIRSILTLPYLHELNIGHSILSRALFTGIREAVREMKSLLSKP